MDLGAILLLIALLVTVGLFLAEPLMSSQARRVSEELPEVSSLMAERDRIVSALQELDFDFKLDKIPSDDYPVQRRQLLEKGAGILRRLDTLAPPRDAAHTLEQDPNSRIEQAVAAGRSDSGMIPELLDDHRIEMMLAARRAARRTKSGGFCPRCGKAVLVTDQFCPNCGKALQ